MGALRFLLALAVVLTHMPGGGIFLPPGDVAVQLFFMISGFYMFLILDRVYVGNMTAFYLNRFLRLWPLYMLVLAITWAMWALVAPDRFAVYGGLDGVLLALSQLSFLGLDAYHFGPGGPPAAVPLLPVPQAWTLSLELYFYLMVPWLCRWRSAWLWGLVAVLTGLRIAAAVAGYHDDPWSYRFFPFELPLFVLGGLAYRAMKDGWALPHQGWLVAGFFVALLGARVWPMPADPYRFAMLVWGFAILPGLFRLTASNKSDRMVGELSYPLYISHLLVVAGLAKVFGAGPWSMAQIALCAMAALAFAAVLHIVVERAIEHLRDRVRPVPSSVTAQVSSKPERKRRNR